MSAFRNFAAIAFACSAVSFYPSVAFAQDAVDPAAAEVENSKYQFEGKINSSAVYIRSGPSDNDYPTMKLDRDANITVVGMKFDWLKITPPKESFCYVAKAYVEKRGAGNVGRVTSPLNVRVGSGLNAMKTKIAAKLEAGQDVDIIGEQDEYFKITPPPGVFVYVNKQFVDPMRPVVAEVPAGGAPADAGSASATPGDPTPTPGPLATNDPANPQGTSPTPDNQNNAGMNPTPPVDQANAAGKTPPSLIADNTQGQSNPTGPVNTSGNPAGIAPPTTQSSEGAVAENTPKAGLTQEQAETEFDRLSAAYSDAARQPLDQQPLEELQSGYEKLVAAAALPSTLQTRAEGDFAIIRQRLQDKLSYIAALAKQDELKQRQLALQAERNELEQIIASNTAQTYAAVGTLRLSSLQNGPEALYRLTDPRSGRTMVYIRSNDPQYASLIGQFIGVKGELADDAQLQLKVIASVSAEPVDPNQVNNRIISPIIPPSMMPQSGTAKVE